MTLLDDMPEISRLLHETTGLPDDLPLLARIQAACAIAQAPPLYRPPLTHVAIRFQGKIWSLPRPYRHHHVIRMICYLDSDVDSVDTMGEDQGFLDKNGRYLTRSQAEISASINGQIKNDGKIIGGRLTSEDLW